MGLDMIPLGKPKEGSENRFEKIYRILTGKEPQATKTKEELLQEWHSIQIPSYVTIQAPRVGKDKEADEWIKEKHQHATEPMSLEEFVKAHDGFYVIELAKEKDGVPMYSPLFGQDRNVFRGQFLKDCIDLIGEDLVYEAWESKLAKDTLDYGERLMRKAIEIAAQHKLEYLKDQRMPPEKNTDTIESQLHILFSLSKWLIFYGKNGHGYEADY